MRIVHVSDCYAPRTGGIESQVRDLAAHQARAGHAVHVLTATADAAGAHRSTVTEPSGVRVHRMASAVTFGLPVHPLGGRLLHRAIARLDPDVVHVHAGLVSPFANDGARAARALGVPLTITWHCMLNGVEAAIRVGARLTGWRTSPVALNAVSRVAADRVAAALGRDDVGVLTNGLDLARWVPGEATGEGDDADVERPLRVVVTQRLVRRKRSVHLVRAVARAAEILGRDATGARRIHLTVAGSGPDEAAVRREAARLGFADGVDVLGRVDREAIPELYARQDVYLSGARLEAFGIAPLEARAAGLVIVARTGTGIAEFVTDGVDGFLVPDDDALVDSLVLLASDVALRRQLLAHNRRVAPDTDFARVVIDAEREYARAQRLVGRVPASAG